MQDTVGRLDQPNPGSHLWRVSSEAVSTDVDLATVFQQEVSITAGVDAVTA